MVWLEDVEKIKIAICGRSDRQRRVPQTGSGKVFRASKFRRRKESSKSRENSTKIREWPQKRAPGLPTSTAQTVQRSNAYVCQRAAASELWAFPAFGQCSPKKEGYVACLPDPLRKKRTKPPLHGRTRGDSCQNSRWHECQGTVLADG